jgi:hypothetical protein
MGTLSVKKVFVKNVTISLNLGQVNIHEITGHLNIGNTYEGNYSELIEEKLIQKLGRVPEKTNKDSC